MNELIEKKITILIPREKETEFDELIKGFIEFYLEGANEESSKDGILLRKQLYLSLISNTISIK